MEKWEEVPEDFWIDPKEHFKSLFDNISGLNNYEKNRFKRAYSSAGSRSKELEEVISWLADFIKRTEDRVRIYHLCRKCLKNLEFSGPVYFAEEPPEELIL